jgi:hypothetical protein
MVCKLGIINWLQLAVCSVRSQQINGANVNKLISHILRPMFVQLYTNRTCIR